MGDWWNGISVNESELDQAVTPHEKAALTAIDAIVKLAEAHPDKVLVIGAALRKISTISQSHAQTISLRSMTVRKAHKV
jgi:hypothetical protein